MERTMNGKRNRCTIRVALCTIVSHMQLEEGFIYLSLQATVVNPPQGVSMGRVGHAAGVSAGVDFPHQSWRNEDGRMEMLLLVQHPAASGAWRPYLRCAQYFPQPSYQHL